jgi:GNAT superfamily N-acetyltransferase
LQAQSLTNYAKYIHEKAGLLLIEESFGFITFEVTKGCIYIHDLWVDIDYRREGYGSKLVQRMIDENKTDNIKFLMASVQLNANNVTDTLKAQLHYGFLVVGGNENEIKLAKEI